MNHDTSNADLRRGYDALLAAREARSDAPRDTPAVALERMLALVEGRGNERERLETLDAVMADPASAREFELLRALAANRPPARPALVLTRRWVLPSSLAAAAALALVALPALRRPAVDGPEVVRDATPDATQGAVLIAPPLEASAAESRTFRWRAVPGAQRYVIEILTAGGTPVFTTRVADTTVTLPADVRLAPDVEHRWWVATELADGTQRRSPFRRLRVRQ